MKVIFITILWLVNLQAIGAASIVEATSVGIKRAITSSFHLTTTILHPPYLRPAFPRYCIHSHVPTIRTFSIHSAVKLMPWESELKQFQTSLEKTTGDPTLGSIGNKVERTLNKINDYIRQNAWQSKECEAAIRQLSELQSQWHMAIDTTCILGLLTNKTHREVVESYNRLMQAYHATAASIVLPIYPEEKNEKTYIKPYVSTALDAALKEADSGNWSIPLGLPILY